MIGPGGEFFSDTAPAARTEPASVLIIGVGNLLMGDEGVGIHILRALETDLPVPGTDLLDGGTGGINLLEAISSVPKVIMIDATRDGQPAGTITLLRPARVVDFPQGTLGA
jgi:hydrogenase maturation protease